MAEDSPTFIGEMLMYQLRWCCDPLDYLPQLVADGPPPSPPEALDTDGMWTRIARAMANWEQAGGPNWRCRSSRISRSSRGVGRRSTWAGARESLGWGMMGRDMAFEQGDIASSMLRVGFKSVRGRTLDTPMGPMDLEIGRKSEAGSRTSKS